LLSAEFEKLVIECTFSNGFDCLTKLYKRGMVWGIACLKVWLNYQIYEEKVIVFFQEKQKRRLL